MEHNSNFFNQHCLSLTRLAVILLIGVMFTCSDDNEAPLDPPAVPTGFSVLSVFDDRVMLVWDEMEGVTHYGLFQNDLELDRNILDPHYTATNLDAITPYLFSLQACNEGGCSPQTRLTLVTAPVTPESLSVEEVTSTTILLSWLASRGATHYVIDTGSIQITNDGADFYEVTNLQAATDYFFTVKACNQYGCSSEVGINITTIPDTPKNFTHGTVTSMTATLKWDTVTGAGFYIVYRGGKAIITNQSSGQGEKDAIEQRVVGLTSNTEEVFGVEACNNSGCSSRATLTLTTAPVAPENFTHGTVTSTTAVLKWDTVTGAGFYIVYQGGKAIITNRSGNRDATTHRVTGLTSNTEEVFGVEACNNSGCSSRTTLTLTTAPDALKSFSVGKVTLYTISLSWGRSLGATHYVIDTGAIQITNQGEKNTSSTIPGLEAGTLYPLKIRACNQYGCSSEVGINITTIPDAPKNFTHGTVTSTTAVLKWDTVTGAGFYIVYRGGKAIITNRSGEKDAIEQRVVGLTSNREEVFGLEACNDYGCSSRTTLTLTTAPVAPKGLAVGEVTSYTISLSWGRSQGATHYVIDTGAIQITNQGGGNTSSTIPGLEGGTRYPLKVRACNGYGCSPETSVDVTTIPATPKNFTAKNITSAAATLEWDAVTGAKEYIFYRGNIPVATNTALTHTVVNLRFFTSYSFSVRACNSRGCSDRALKRVITLEAPDSFSIAYPNMESTTPDSSRPVFVSSESCNILDYTFAGKARYSIDRNTIGSDEPVLPTIDPITGVVSNNGVATPGAYRVTVTVPENVDCNTNFLVYNTVTPADRSELEAAVDSGIGFHGNTGNFNYIITSRITDMSWLFYYKSSFNGDITEWDTSQVEDMSVMFAGAGKFNEDISGWDTSQVRNMNEMFEDARAFNQPLNDWDTSKVVRMSLMFDGAWNFNQPLSNWDTSKVRDMNSMFYWAESFNQPLSNWDTSKVEDMTEMFLNATSFNQDLSGWVVTNVRNHWQVFDGSAMADKTEQHPKWPTDD